ncbi:MAG: hypothetical protein VX335_04390 [Pseudomonadota bacterium]|nr:hypothetical protein [Pseudomonadota bacterium]
MTTRPNKNLLILGFISLICATVSTFLGNTYPIFATFYDLWLPQISGHALQSGLQPHIDFHSPFGILYHKLNQLNFHLINSLPNLLQNFDINMLNSLFFAALVAIIFFLMQKSSTKNISGLILLLIISLILQMRPLSNISQLIHYNDMAWCGIYNNQMLGIILLQFSQATNFQKNYAEKNIKIGEILVTAVIQAICVFITFNFKVNFALAAIIINISIMTILCKKHAIKYFFAATSTFVFLTILTVFWFEYSYQHYFIDLVQAMEAKQDLGDIISSRPLQLLQFFSVIFLYNLATCRIRYFSQPTFLNYKLKELPLSFLRILVKKSNEMYKKVMEEKRVFFFDLINSTIIISMIVGDTLYPNGLAHALLMLLIFITIHAKSDLMNKMSNIIIWLLIGINILALIIITSYKIGITGHNNSHNIIKTSKKNFEFIVENYSGLDNLYNTIYKEDKEKLKDYLIAQSYSYKPFKHNWRIPFNNIEYIAMINEGIRTIEKLNIYESNKILMLAFANPLPMLLNKPYPKNQYQWLDIFITFSPRKLTFLEEIFMNSDIVYMPLLTPDKHINPAAQTFMNCSFYRWNNVHKNYVLVNVSKYGLTFSKKGVTPAQEIPLNNTSNILTKCNDIEKSIYNDYNIRNKG